jgi:hypothetical protein
VVYGHMGAAGLPFGHGFRAEEMTNPFWIGCFYFFTLPFWTKNFHKTYLSELIRVFL